MNTISTELHRVLDEVDTSDREADARELGEDGVANTEDPKRMSASLYKVLVQIVKDEPFMIVRGVSDTDGMEAWRLLGQKCISTTPAATLIDLMRLAGRMEEWQIRVDALRWEHAEEGSPREVQIRHPHEI